MQDPQDPVAAYGPDTPDSASLTTPAVLIVTARRGRMLDALLPPALIAVAAGLVLAYRGVQKEWDGLSLPVLAAVAKANPTVVKTQPITPKEPAKAIAKVEPSPAPTPAPAPVVALADAGPKLPLMPETKLTDAAKARVWDDIELEARKTREQQAELERIKIEEDEKAAAAPPPIDRKPLKLHLAKADVEALIKAQMQLRRKMEEQLAGAHADMQRRHLQQVEAMRRSWINGGGLPNRMGGRPGVPFPPRPMPPGPPQHEAFADLQVGAQAEPQVRTEFRQFSGPGNLSGYVFRRQTIVKANEPPPIPRPIGEAENE